MANGEREQLWQERIDQWRSSGLSQRAFALQHGYAVRQVGDWVRRLAKKAPPVMAMVPMMVTPAVEPAAPALVLRAAQGWSLELPAGTPATWLAELLRSL